MTANKLLGGRCMLDYKNIINKRYLFNMSGREIADQLGVCGR